VIFLNVIK